MIVTCSECRGRFAHTVRKCPHCRYAGSPEKGFRHAGFCSVEVYSSIMGRASVECPKCRRGTIEVDKEKEYADRDARGGKSGSNLIRYTGRCSSCRAMLFSFEYSWGSLHVM